MSAKRHAVILAYGLAGLAAIAAICGVILLAGYGLRLLGVPHDLAYAIPFLTPVVGAFVYWIGWVLTDYGDAVRR